MCLIRRGSGCANSFGGCRTVFAWFSLVALAGVNDVEVLKKRGFYKVFPNDTNSFVHVNRSA